MTAAPDLWTDLRAIEPLLKRLLAWLSTADHAYDTAIVRARKYASTLERDREFGVVGSRVGGSIGKGTAIRPVSDVDLRRGIRLLKYWNRRAGLNLHSYAVEVLGMYVVTQGCKRTALGVFQAALEFMSTTRMRTPVVIERYYRYRPHARRACIILDPAMPDNNLGGHLDSRIGDDLGTAARRSLRKLAKAAKAAHFAEKGRLPVAAEWLSEAFGESGLIK